MYYHAMVIINRKKTGGNEIDLFDSPNSEFQIKSMMIQK